MSYNKERLEAKLKLWDNPSFIAFIEDFHNLEDNPIDVKGGVLMIKVGYQKELAKIEEKESKYKQGKLGL